jgi:hypothetical protein
MWTKEMFCGHKGKFGLNCLAVSDICGQILDLLIGLPGMSLDCIAFKGSGLYERLEGGLLKNKGLVLFGDNAYLNTSYMTTPFPNVSSGCKDDYNVFQSQLRIRVERAFGQLVSRWGILRSAIPLNITILKTVALVSCLAWLHNFCIDKGDRLCEVSLVEETLPSDLKNMMNNHDGYVPLMMEDNHDIAIPLAIMDTGHHFDDCP